MILNKTILFCCLFSFFCHYASGLAMEEKKEHLFIRTLNATSPFITPLAPFTTALLELKLPTSTLTKVICLLIPYLSFILYIFEMLYARQQMRNIPINNGATLYSSRQHTEKISLYNLIKNQPALRSIKRIANKLSINARNLMVILGTGYTCSYFNHIGLEENFNKQLPAKSEKNAVIGHELCHVHDKANYKDLAVHCMVPLLTDCTIACLKAYGDAGIFSAGEYVNLLQENWLYRILPMYVLGFPALHIMARYYEKRADIVSARLGKSAQDFSNYCYTCHIHMQKQLEGKKLLGSVLQLLDEHPAPLDRALYLADIAIKEQHARPCDLLVYNATLVRKYIKALQRDTDKSELIMVQ